MELNSQTDIQSLIDNNAEESTTLEFKAAGALAKEKKDDIAKDISAFANSAGGTLIYGLNEIEHKANNVSFIDGNTFTKEWLEQVINSNIERRIDSLRIIPIRFDNKINQTVYVVQIPESTNAPHQAPDGKFYRRFNFIATKMEEYEIRVLYNRRSKTDLVIADILTNNKGGSVQPPDIIIHADFSLGFQVRNRSTSIETLYKLEIHMPALIMGEVSQQPNFTDCFIRNDGNYRIYSVPSKSPLFQDEVTTMAEAIVRINKGGFMTLATHPVKLKLYYSNGLSQRKIQLDEILGYARHQPLTIDSFSR